MKKCFLVVLAILLLVALIIGGCAKPAPTPAPTPAPSTETVIPSHFTTYTDEVGLFSISYPPDWEPALSVMEELVEYTTDILKNIDEDLPIEEATLIFLGGKPTETGYLPNVSIVLEPLPPGVSTCDEYAEASVRGVKAVVQDYNEFSRIKTTIDGREATILEYEGTFPEIGKWRYLATTLVQGKTGWTVSCCSQVGEFSKWKDDFHAIARSLRILK